jgi:hypothetical protein
MTGVVSTASRRVERIRPHQAREEDMQRRKARSDGERKMLNDITKLPLGNDRERARTGEFTTNFRSRRCTAAREIAKAATTDFGNL